MFSSVWEIFNFDVISSFCELKQMHADRAVL